MKYRLFSATLLAFAIVLDTAGFAGAPVMLAGGVSRTRSDN
jgi:hypothetical protein